MSLKSPNGGKVSVMQTMSMTQVLTGKFRRNGKLQSCEPCRKSKLACDHVVPTCGRCVKRRRIDQCVYHPSPLTRSRQTPSPPIPTPSRSITYESPQAPIQSVESPQSEHHTDSVPSTSDTRPAHTEAPIKVRRAASAPPLDHPCLSAVRGNTGFLGATSYSSILSEGLGNLDATPDDLEISHRQSISIPTDGITRGCRILSFLKDHLVIHRFVMRWYEIGEGAGGLCIEPIMKEWLLKLWSYHADTLRSQDPEKIRRLCDLLWRNTQTRLAYNGNISAIDWARLGTGINIRWEVIGLIAAIVGLTANSLDPSDPFLSEHKVKRDVLSKKMSEVSEACLSFSRDCETLDDMFLWLVFENSGLTSALRGDGAYASYLASGEMINATIAMGLHQGIKVDDRVPFFIAELRKRAFIVTYCMEVSLATFLGRPPRLSYRYCTIDRPLDLTDKQVVLDGPELAAALAELDQDGYNTSGRIHQMTYMRAWLGIAPRREDILDLALGHYSRDEVLQRAEVIRQKTEAHWAKVPPFIGKAREAVDLGTGRPLQMLYRTAVRQGSRANELLLQRVLIRKTGASSVVLIHTAREIFRDILQITQRHDIASMFQMDFKNLLVAHGLRSGGILAVELLKQEQLPVYPDKPLLPRSQTIQDLSVFAARLGTVGPSDGIFGTCDQGRKVITRILDKILTPNPAPQHPTAACRCSQPQQYHQQDLGQMDLDVAATQAGQEIAFSVPEAPSTAIVDLGIIDAPMSLGHDNDFMQWLESMDWERADTWSGF